MSFWKNTIHTNGEAFPESRLKKIPTGTKYKDVRNNNNKFWKTSKTMTPNKAGNSFMQKRFIWRKWIAWKSSYWADLLPQNAEGIWPLILLEGGSGPYTAMKIVIHIRIRILWMMNQLPKWHWLFVPLELPSNYCFNRQFMRQTSYYATIALHTSYNVQVLENGTLQSGTVILILQNGKQ